MKYSSFVPYLIIVVGPTASGKSGLAMTLAQSEVLGRAGVILNADSRQVYKEMDIGTAKPSLADRQAVPHYFVDICEPTEVLTVAEYQQQAQEAIAHIHKAATQVPLLVGGTGLYINAIAKGLKIPRVPPNTDLRSQLTNLGQPHCYALLSQVDPESTNRIHPNDQVRTLRALEVFYVSGRTISSQQGENPPHYPILYIGLECDVELLRSRITQRVHQMIAAGLANEVAGLIEKYGPTLPLLKTLGYAEIQQHLNGEISIDSAIDLIVQHTCQFAKRQRTWFRKEPRIEWFTVGEPSLTAQVLERVDDFVNTLSQ